MSSFGAWKNSLCPGCFRSRSVSPFGLRAITRNGNCPKSPLMMDTAWKTGPERSTVVPFIEMPLSVSAPPRYQSISHCAGSDKLLSCGC